MTPGEYIKLLNEQKAKAEKRFGGLTSFQADLLGVGFDYLTNNLDLSNGTFSVTDDLPKLMNEFVLSIVAVAGKNKEYEGAVSNYISDINDIGANIEEFQGSYNRIKTGLPRVKETQKAVVNEIINQYSENGLNVHFAQPLRDLIFSNILGGMSLKEAKQQLKEYILGGSDGSGKLSQYLEQTAQQGVDSYTGAINMKLKQEYNFTGYIISGSLIATSSSQCREAIRESEAGYLDFEQWQKILDVARNNKKAKLIDGTTIDNLPLNKLHWGCRHEFTPIIKKGVESTPKPKEEQKQAPKPRQKAIKENIVEPVDKGQEARAAFEAENAKQIKKLKENGFILPQELHNKLPGVKIDTSRATCYNPSTKTIQVKVNDARWKGSKFGREMVYIHEAAHAFHMVNDIITTKSIEPGFTALYNDLRETIKGQEKRLHDILINVKRTTPEESEKKLMFADILGSLTRGRFGWGHQKGYYRMGNYSEMEVFAHAITVHYLENDRQDLDPIFKTLVTKMKAYASNILKSK